jgi:hypothetical protein
MSLIIHLIITTMIGFKANSKETYMRGGKTAHSLGIVPSTMSRRFPQEFGMSSFDL